MCFKLVKKCIIVLKDKCFYLEKQLIEKFLGDGYLVLKLINILVSKVVKI